MYKFKISWNLFFVPLLRELWKISSSVIITQKENYNTSVINVRAEGIYKKRKQNETQEQEINKYKNEETLNFK